MEIEMVIKQSLGSSSQQGETIEVRHRAMASCKESSTFPLLTMEEFIQSRICSGHFDRSAHRDCYRGYHCYGRFAFTGIRGKSWFIVKFRITFAPPRWIIPGSQRGHLTLSLGCCCERQLIVSTTEVIQYTHSTELVDAIQDRDLRSLIAPPMTSLEEAMVISLAGTWSILSETREKHYWDKHLRVKHLVRLCEECKHLWGSQHQITHSQWGEINTKIYVYVYISI